MDMMYMPDALNAIISLMETESHRLIHRNAFNVSAMSVDPEAIAKSIKKIIPNFTLSYNVDPIRQKIAEFLAQFHRLFFCKKEWGFKTSYDLDQMTLDMINMLQSKLKT
jgi:nucleoside-diphosphate-sugar epimerase